MSNVTHETTLPQIELRGVAKRFAAPGGGHQEVLQQFSLSIAPGEFVCLLGPSGCGKSTVLNLLAGFEQPDAGLLRFEGRPVTAPGPERGVVFQQPQLFPWLDVLGNVCLGPRLAGQPLAAVQERARELLARVGLRGFERHRPYQLSGGMRQRAALARAWLPEPRVLLMDEPFGALDAQTRLMMQELLISVWQAQRTTVLFITHDVDEALSLGDRVLLMSTRPGRVIEELVLPFERPRRLEDLVADPRYGELKRRVLQRLREQAAPVAVD
ncbi:ABC transporter ATP-binding protein [Roseateles sp. DAIF2]|uniref:ABC transporter ATP-binding protein n=1 Tax=Roseateles sp. DAIF2 TaxID=2714952 RepID=UPI0018A2FD09|nr:ABC transporter ATP-binding protein [Roseateles sp. DAIF2]QPF73898.1 ABC transporter ATP-binding protein [Roseateles sp. DAIF2]